MKRLFSIIFPYFDWLYILQSVEYQPNLFIKWVLKNYFKRDLQQKKKLVWTPKIVILFLISAFLIFAGYFVSISVMLYYQYTDSILMVSEFIILMQLSFVYIWMASLLFAPIDEFVKSIYVELAARKIRKQPKLTVIGITGSYGKTSTKEILYSLLSTQYKVVRTPYSVNTVVGVAKIILKQLQKDVEILIVEMGAYKKGEIAKICKLVKPTMGIITGLNEQHLERFKTIENILAAKTELIAALPRDGIIAINIDNEHLRDFYFEHLKGNHYLKAIPYSLHYYSDWQAKKVELVQQDTFVGTRFQITFDKQTLELKTKLLGKHQVLNLVGALTLSNELRIKSSRWPEIVAQVNAIPHRMELVPTHNSVTVIDDAYSGNPSGFEAALETIAQFNNPRKIVVTPGIVELGKKEAEIHQHIGEKMAKVSDLIILIGKKNLSDNNKRLDNILKGLKKAHFEEKNLLLSPTLKDAEKIIAQTTKPDDLIIFCNDLPDHY